nr:TadE/TadG family type IV pilus assembly protein [Fredinandcohnia onubensis]
MKRTYQFIKHLYKDQSGVSMVLVALLMVVMLGFSAIVVDAGALYLKKSQLQSALDAAVLAGAQELRGVAFDGTIETRAKQSAIDIAQENGLTIVDAGTEDNKIVVTQDSVEVTQTVKENLYFARVLSPDLTDTDVKAHAKAEIQSLINPDGAIPVAFKRQLLQDGSFGQEFRLKADSSETGNYGFLAIGGQGADVLAKGIKEGVTVNIGDKPDTEPGSISSVTDVFDDRIKEDNNDPNKKERCNDPTTVDNTCRRLVTIPLVDVETYPNGRKEIEIVGLAAFLLTEASGNGNSTVITGKFIEYKLKNNYTPNQGFPETIRKVKLVN